MKITAPLKGVLVPLNLINDAVFSQKMAGDGIAIDPASNILIAPINGTVTFIHPCQHAVTLKSSEHPDVEILIHIGVDTIKLKGQGFESFIKNGDTVKVGQKLIEFDLDFISQKAKSPHTLILVTNTVENSMKYQIQFPESSNSFITDLKSTLFNLNISSLESKTATGPTNLGSYKQTLACPVASGLHARPASMIAQLALKYTDGVVEIKKGSQRANAKSLTSLMALSVTFNEQIEISASGAHAETTVKALVNLLNSLNHDKPAAMTPQTAHAASAATPKDANIYTGITVATGDVQGQIWQFQTNDIVVTDSQSKNSNSENESPRLKKAISEAQSQIETTITSLDPKDSVKKSIYQAHLELLNDPEIWTLALAKMNSGSSAEYSWQQAIDKTKSILTALKNEVMAERAHDVRDIGQKVLRILLQLSDKDFSKKLNLSGAHVLVARNLKY